MRVEIWSDIVCPWCYIGKRRFEAALDEFDENVDIVYRSFELAPNAPKQVSGSLEEVLAAKYGMSSSRARQVVAQINQAAGGEGLDFDLSSAQSGNTFDAHRLLRFARSKGLQGEVKERLMQAYFIEGRSISEHTELAKIAAEAGLDAEQVREMLGGDGFANEVREDETRASQLGVRGVPHFLFDGAVAISGAQPPATFLKALQKVQADQEATRVAACDEGMCEIRED